jgi:acetyl esterase/lipase
MKTRVERALFAAFIGFVLLAVLWSLLVSVSYASAAMTTLTRVNGVSTSPCPNAEKWAYGSDPAQHVFIYGRKAAGSNRPLIVFYHGGGWVSGTACGGHPPFTKLLAAGYVVASVEYRLWKKEGDLQNAADDATSALVALRANAYALGASKYAVATLGTSAGGHLAHLAANRAGGVRTTVSWSGFPDLQGLITSYYKGTPESKLTDTDLAPASGMASRARVPEGTDAAAWWKAVDPIASVAASPIRQLLFVNAQDGYTLPSMPAHYAEVARAAGKSVRVVGVSVPDLHGIHFFDDARVKPQLDYAYTWLAKALANLSWGSFPAPTAKASVTSGVVSARWYDAAWADQAYAPYGATSTLWVPDGDTWKKVDSARVYWRNNRARVTFPTARIPAGSRYEVRVSYDTGRTARAAFTA